MSAVTHRIPGLVLREHRFDAPLDPARPDGETLALFAREATATEKEGEELPWLVFLQGGPGFAAPRPLTRSGWLARAVREFRVLLLDMRGTGRSSRIDARALALRGGPAQQAEHLALFRADAIVRDCEWIRRRLLAPGQRWTVLGQSFGSFCAVHYLCAAPEGLAGALFTGGLPPLEAHADEVYRRTYALVAERCRRYYARYPEDVEHVRRIAAHLEAREVRLPSGDRLSVRRLQSLGILLGAGDGAEALHYLLEAPWVAGREGEELAYAFLRAVENATAFDTNPLYAVLHEACYAQGAATRWSAERVRAEFPELDPRAEGPLAFTGEMVYPWMLEECAALRPLRAAADLLADREGWPALYDRARLAENRVPCAAAIYYHDMYVARDLAEETARAIRGMVPWYTSEHEHDALRASGERVLDRLLTLLREHPGT